MENSCSKKADNAAVFTSLAAERQCVLCPVIPLAWFLLLMILLPREERPTTWNPKAE